MNQAPTQLFLQIPTLKPKNKKWGLSPFIHLFHAFIPDESNLYKKSLKLLSLSKTK